MTVGTIHSEKRHTKFAPRIVRPHEGKQEDMLASSADIVIGGGGAGGGKTVGLILEPMRHLGVKGFNAVIFRRTYPELTNPGGLWAETKKFYPLAGGRAKEQPLEWHFGQGHEAPLIKLGHIQYDKDVYDWQGSQICLLEFDQLEHFTEWAFFYMLSRNRSTCGVTPYCRATCNPDPDSWLAKFLEWWIDQDTGYPILNRSGKVRHMVRVNDQIHWYNTRHEAVAGARELGVGEVEALQMPKTVTFIAMLLKDNPTLAKVDPTYIANLYALPLVERERLLSGNWKIRPTAGKVFNREWFEIVEKAPARGRRARYWDKAATQDGGALTVGTKLLKHGEGDQSQFFVEDVVYGKWSALQREKIIRQTAELDGEDVHQYHEQEPGSGGKESAENTTRNLAGFVTYADKVTGDKFERAGPVRAQAEAGNVKIVKHSGWNEPFLRSLHSMDATVKKQERGFMDSLSGGFNKLARHKHGFAIV